MWILKQKAESRKLLAVLSSVLGILVITFDDMPWSTMETGNEQVEAVLDAAIGSNSTIIADYSSDDADIGVILPAIWADALLALSAICYGLYEVIFAKYSTTDLTIPLDDDMIDNTSPLSASPSKRLSTEFPPSVLQSNHGNHDGRGDEESLFLANQIIGFIGLTTILIWWVPIIILNSTNVETFGLPQDQHTWALIAVDIICSFLHNTLYMLTITLIGPVFASIGVIVSINDKNHPAILTIKIGDFDYSIRCAGRLRGLAGTIVWSARAYWVSANYARFRFVLGSKFQFAIRLALKAAHNRTCSFCLLKTGRHSFVASSR